MRERWFFLILAFLGIALSSCDRGKSGPLKVLRVNVEERRQLPLNQEVLLFFSENVDPSTVNVQTIRIREVGEEPTNAQGYYRVEGREVHFHPALQCDPNHPEGGFQPNRTYRLTVPGRERKGAMVRGTNGESLRVSYETLFSTSNEYVDAFPDNPFVISTIPETSASPHEYNVPVGTFSDPAKIEIFFSEPLDPQSVTEKSVSLWICSLKPSRCIRGSVKLFQSPEEVKAVFQPYYPLPERAELEVLATSFIHDLGGNPLEPYSGRLRTEDALPLESVLIEEFTDSSKEDEENTTAEWNVGNSGCLRAGIGYGGDGRDGPFVPSDSVVLNTSENGGTYYFSQVKINKGITVRGEGEGPLRILATGSVVIEGTIDLSGQDGEDGVFNGGGEVVPGGAGGCGGGRGGDGNPIPGSFSREGERGEGPFGGLGGGWGGGRHPDAAGGGGGGSYGEMGTPGGHTGEEEGGEDQSEPGEVYGDPWISMLVGGSGGGGGGNDDDGNEDPGMDDTGGGGGGGGGALEILATREVRFSGVILSKGGNGGDAGSVGAGGGGGGSGGSVCIRAREIFLLEGSAITAPGGIGGIEGTHLGGDGGEGRISLSDYDGIMAMENSSFFPQPFSGIFTPSEGSGISAAQSRFFNTGVLSPDYRFDASDPFSGRIVPHSVLDIGLPEGIPENTSIYIFFEGAEEDPFNAGFPDTNTCTGFLTNIDEADGHQFIRFRILFDIGPVDTLNAPRPIISYLHIPFRCFH